MCKKIVVFCFLVFSFLHSFGQDTVCYLGVLKKALAYESFELYPDSTFKWCSEYDLSFEKHGFYTVKDERLVLSYYPDSVSRNLNDSTLTFSEFFDKEIYLIEGKQLFLLNKKGKKLKKRKAPSIKTSWSWLLGRKYSYEIRKTSL